MGNIIVAMPQIEDAKKISEILRSRGFDVIQICTTGADVLSHAYQLESGIVVCTRNLNDMYCNEMLEDLPDYFEMLILTSPEGLAHCPSGVMTVTMPFMTSYLVSSVEMMLVQLAKRIHRAKGSSKKRNRQQQAYIDEAKELLMARNNLTEQEAFRYIQKCSMDSGTNMVETAQMILLLQRD